MILTTYLVVKDMATSLAFYKTYFQNEPVGSCPERFAIFNVANTSLALYNPLFDNELIKKGKDLQKYFNAVYIADNKKTISYGNNVVLNIGVDDLAYEYERVKKLAIGEISEIMYVNIVMPYYYFNFYDPDGNCLEITGRYDLNES